MTRRKASFLTVTDLDFARVMARIDQNGPIPSDPSRPLTTGCWLWLGGLIPAGYGSVSIRNETQMVHRVVYSRFVGPLPLDLDIDHICRVRRCCRPDHIEPVTPAENQHRAQRPTCRRGHPFDDVNTGPVKGRPHQRVCRACSREKTRRHRERRAQHVA